MKKILTFLIVGVLTSSCSNDNDEGADCSLFDPAFPELYIRLVDETGANLIENGTIDLNKITIDGNFLNPDFLYIPSNEFAVPDAEISKYDNTLLLFIPRESKFEYTITLNNTTSAVLKFDAKLAKLPCGVSYFIPIRLTFNNQNIDSENEESELKFLAEIEI